MNIYVCICTLSIIYIPAVEAFTAFTTHFATGMPSKPYLGPATASVPTVKAVTAFTIHFTTGLSAKPDLGRATGVYSEFRPWRACYSVYYTLYYFP